jgi:glycosyltransferase involved in cell wall biosynthesis
MDDVHRPFDRVRCVASEYVEAGPLVTVVVSAWQPDDGLFTAIDSLLAQSWTPLEILIVDDASPETYGPLIDKVAALDPRIRVIRQPRNGGTYVARNTAMQEAKGEFMTFLDSDDWCHPRRIEHQARLLVDNPELMSTTSRALRTNQDLVFNLPGVLAQRENASSLMFRLAPVRDRIGYFDTVRKAADTEYALRIRRAFGADSHRIVEENLSLIRLTTGSLSREEFKPGWRHPSRAAYRRNYEHWHRASAAGGGSLLAQSAIDHRNFPAPDRFQVERDGAEVTRRSAFDIAFVADLRHGDENLRAMFDEIRACQQAGARVAVIHMESFRHMARIELELFWPPIQDAIASGEIDEILLTDSASIGTIVVRDPVVLQFASLKCCGLRTDRVIVMVGDPPRDISKALWYVPSECMRNAQIIFGARIHWVPQSVRVQQALRERLPKSTLENDSLPVVVDAEAWQCPKRRVNRKAPIIGRMSPDSAGNFPSSARKLLAAYPAEGRYDVRMLGGRSVCDALLGYRPLPHNWSFPDPVHISAAVFLSSCDFFVYFDRESRKPEPLRRLLEAMASGCVVILPAKFVSLFADAAVYCEPQEVPETVDRFAADGALFESQSRRARQFVENGHDPARFAHALKELAQHSW